ncbi:MAG: hypothetical protein OEW24_06185, partial [Chloroflexota bacterium]|nr:hypothetical protein [Chloroflexota bacterium]
MGGSLIELQRNAMRLRKAVVDWAGWSGQIYFQHRVDQYRSMWQQVAAAQGGTFSELASDLWQIEIGARRVRVLNHELEFDNPVTLGLAGRKPVVHRLLDSAGLAVPGYAVFTLDHLDEARRFVERHPMGCVIKPAGGYGGKGVTTHVQRPGEVRRAALLASLYDTELLVEAMVPGESYRLLVLEGKVIDVVGRRGPRIEADGASTVRQLIAAENRRRRTVQSPPIEIDRDCLFTLTSQGLTLESRPKAGRVLLAKSIADRGRRYVEVRTVYTQPADDLICDSIRHDAETAAAVVGSDFLGVDVITPDPSVPLRESGGVINEVNTTPALHHHYDASRQAYPDAAVLILQALLRR